MAWSDIWKIKYNTTRAKAVLDELLPSMTEAITTQLGSLESFQSQVRVIIGNVTPPIGLYLYPIHIAAAYAMWASCNKQPGGTTHDFEMSGIIARFVYRGLTESTLLAIAYECFGWSPPTE